VAKHTFIWQGNNRQAQVVRGTMTAGSKREVMDALQQQRIRVTHVRRQIERPTWLMPQPRVRAQDITFVTRQLATLLQSGVPLLQAFDIIAKGTRQPALQSLLQDLRQRVEGGQALHQALRQHTVFDALFCNLVAAAEMAGMLDTVLEQIAHHREKSHALHIALRSALVYPCTVLVIALVVMALLLSFVVPAFQTIFASFGAELPALTRGVIALSEAWQTGGWWVLLALAGLVWAAHRYSRQHLRWQYWRDAALLRLPVAGHLIRHACLARWTRTLTTLFAAGVTLTDALEAVQGVTGNLRYAHATQSVQTQLMRGLSLAQAIQQQEDLFEPLVVQMCAIGEESGALEHMLDKTALHYERDVETTVARMATLLEPFIMVVLGLLIGGMVMALYLPIFQLGQVV
jgi:type IV pilus assembly protein PilC